MLKYKILNYKQQTFKWKWVLLSSLVIVLISIGHLEAYIKDALLVYFNSILIEEPGSDLIPVTAKTSNRMTSLVYRLLYCSLCMLIIHVYFFKPKITKIAILLYLLLFTLTLGLYMAAAQFQLSQLHVVAFRIDTLLVSPMPVVILIPALYLTTSIKQ